MAKSNLNCLSVSTDTECRLKIKTCSHGPFGPEIELGVLWYRHFNHWQTRSSLLLSVVSLFDLLRLLDLALLAAGSGLLRLGRPLGLLWGA